MDMSLAIEVLDRVSGLDATTMMWTVAMGVIALSVYAIYAVQKANSR